MVKKGPLAEGKRKRIPAAPNWYWETKGKNGSKIIGRRWENARSGGKGGPEILGVGRRP